MRVVQYPPRRPLPAWVEKWAVQYAVELHRAGLDRGEIGYTAGVVAYKAQEDSDEL